MAYFDLVRMEAPEKKFSTALGFKKILTTSQIEIVDGKSLGNKTYIVRNSEPGVLGRALKHNGVIGIIINDSEMLRMTIEETAESEKILFLPTYDITCLDTRTRLRNLYRTRHLLAFATRSKAKTSLITLAEEKADMLSSSQMIELAMFIGAKEESAKKMLSALGEYCDT